MRVPDREPELPQPKKHPTARARANKAATAQTLTRGESHDVPSLPDRDDELDDNGDPMLWHPQTLAWWDAIWRSPLPGAWESFDIPTLYTLALLYNDIWTARTAKERKDAAGEYRLQRKDFFIAPYDRLRGEIVFAEADAAKRQVAARRVVAAVTQPAEATDPRMILGQ